MLNDSRRAAYRFYKNLKSNLKLDLLFSTSTFTGNLLLSLIITYFFRQLNYGDAVDYVFFLTILSIGLWVTEAIPPFAVGIFLLAMLVVGFGTDFIIDESAPIEMYIDTWTSNVMWLLLGGFFLAEGMREAQLDQALFRWTIRRFGEQPENLLLGMMFTTAIGSMVMSNTATTAMMISSVLPLIRQLGKASSFSKALLLGIPSAASLGGVGTIIGSTPNAIAVGALQERGITITFLDWMIVGLPTALFLIYLFWRYLVRQLELKEVILTFGDILQETSNGNVYKRYAVIFTLLITVLLWLTEPLHGIPVAGTSVVPIVLLTLTQVITADQIRNLPWETLMLVAGGLGLGIALVDVGLAEIIMNKINSLPIAILGIAIVFSFVAVLLSNVMSNTAAASILVPLGISLTAPLNIAVPVIIAISCSCALFLPVSTPSNAIAYATGMIEQKDFRIGGWFFILLGPIVAFAAVMFWVWVYF
jgi:sodium-dependent dicarboxylate transporter 2/3/5